MPKTEDYSTRKATVEDAIDLVILGKQFVRESQNTFLGWDNSKVYRFVCDSIDRDDFGVFVMCLDEEVVGMLICLVTPCFFSDVKQAVELVWYVSPEHRGSKRAYELLDSYEEWAKDHGAVCTNLINLNVLEAAKVEKLYKRRGYTLVENTFLKEL